MLTSSGAIKTRSTDLGGVAPLSLTLGSDESGLDQISRIFNLRSRCAGSQRATISQSNAGDLPPTVSVADVKKVEGNSGQSFMRFTVQLSAPVGYDTRVVYGTEAGTATDGVDYTSVAEAVVTIAAGESSGFIAHNCFAILCWQPCLPVCSEQLTFA